MSRQLVIIKKLKHLCYKAKQFVGVLFGLAIGLACSAYSTTEHYYPFVCKRAACKDVHEPIDSCGIGKREVRHEENFVELITGTRGLKGCSNCRGLWGSRDGRRLKTSRGYGRCWSRRGRVALADVLETAVGEPAISMVPEESTDAVRDVQQTRVG